MRQRYPLHIALAALLMMASIAHGDVNSGQAVLTWLTISGNARDAAMGETVVFSAGDAGAATQNPAGLSYVPHASTYLGVTNWLAGMSITDFSAAYGATPFGTVAVSFRSMNYGEFEFTAFANNSAGYVDLSDDAVGNIGSYSASLAIGRNLTEQLRAGMQVKYVQDELGTYDIVTTPGDTSFGSGARMNAMMFDFGTTFHTAFRTLAVGMVLQNVGQRTSVSTGSDTYKPPMVMRLGVGANLVEMLGFFDPAVSAQTSFEYSNPQDGPEYWNVGTEVAYRTSTDLFAALRGGWRGNQIGGLTLGVGFGGHAGPTDISFNYSWTDYGATLGNVSRIGLSVRF